MDAPVEGQTEAGQPAADGKWVFLHEDGDTAKELLLDEQDSDAASIENALEGQESAYDNKKFLWWIRWAWDDVSIRSALWDDARPYVLIAALGGYTGLHVLAVLASVAGCDALQALFISLEHFAAATLSTAVISMITRFRSLMAVKASTVKSPKLLSLLNSVFVTNLYLIPVACFASIYEVGAGVTVFQEARREEDFGWFLQLLADMARVHVLTAALALSASLVFLVGTDVVTAHRAIVTHLRVTAEYRKQAFIKWSQERRAKQKPSLYLTIAFAVVSFGVIFAIFFDMLFLTCTGPSAHLAHADSAASGGI
ncbi:hypothetical protein MTO96_017027 [Rhipicephalus appendiculatus]